MLTRVGERGCVFIVSLYIIYMKLLIILVLFYNICQFRAKVAFIGRKFIVITE